MIEKNEIRAMQLFYLSKLVKMVGCEAGELFEELAGKNEVKDAYLVYKDLVNRDESSALVKKLEQVAGEDEFAAEAYPNMLPVFSIVKPVDTGYDKKEKSDEKYYSWQYISEEGMPYQENTGQLHKYKESFIKDMKVLSKDFNDARLDVFLQKYGSFVAWGKDKHYISLYHRMKTIISILDAVNENDDCLLIGADLSGIQDFVYTISSDNALRTLRARSFYLECLMEHTAWKVIEHLGLSKYNLIYSGGGGFYILSKGGAEVEEYIRQRYEDINRRLFYLFQGAIYMTLDSVPISKSTLIAGSHQGLAEAFTAIAERLQNQKVTKYKYMLDEVLEIRDPEYRECSVCHSTTVEIGSSGHFEEPVCVLCDGFARLGQRLKDKRYKYLILKEKIIELRDGRQVGCLDIDLYKELEEEAVKGYYTLNSFSLEDYGPGCKGSMIAGNYSYERENSIDFDKFAKESRGISLIGALRMDVDDLGSLFSTRIGESGNRRLEVYTALSNHLNLFFKYYLNRICEGDVEYQFEICPRDEKRRKVTVVYSGGDDLFIVGSWDDVAELGFDIRIAFREFTGGDNVTLSGGMTVQKPKFPLYQMAELSKRAEARAKGNKYDLREKDSYCMFYSSWLDAAISRINKHNKISGQRRKDVLKGEFPWERAGDIQDLVKALYRMIQLLPHGYVNKLFEVLEVYRYEGEFYKPYMYRIVMNIREKLEKDKVPDANELVELMEGLYSDTQPVRGVSFKDMNVLHIPLTWSEYLNREQVDLK